MLISWKGSLIKSVAIAFINGLITLILLLIAPLGLAVVVINTIAIFISTLAVTMAFDLITLWLLKSPTNNFLDYPYQSSKIDTIQPRKNIKLNIKNYEDE